MPHAVHRCAKYFVALGVKKENLLAVDVKVSRQGLSRVMQLVVTRFIT